jgi:hypothetical protein
LIYRCLLECASYVGGIGPVFCPFCLNRFDTPFRSVPSKAFQDNKYTCLTAVILILLLYLFIQYETCSFCCIKRFFVIMRFEFIAVYLYQLGCKGFMIRKPFVLFFNSPAG